MPLPPEVGGVCQPYSMLPLFARTGHDPKYATPAMGTLVPLDRSELSIRMCLIAPSYVQRAAQAAGVKTMVMIRPRGIELVKNAGANPLPRLALARHRGARTFADFIEGLD
jgi:hypothetical protein